MKPYALPKESYDACKCKHCKPAHKSNGRIINRRIQRHAVRQNVKAQLKDADNA